MDAAWDPCCGGEKLVVVKVVIVIGVTVVVGLSLWAVLGGLAGDIGNTILAPHVELLSFDALPGACQTSYWWIFPTGQYTLVTANLTLKNSGPSNGKATIVFTEDGSKVSQQDFFIGAGEKVTASAQFQVGDCNSHQYGAYIGNVQPA